MAIPVRRMEISNALRALEEENRKLKKLLAETMLDARCFDAGGYASKKLLMPSSRRRALTWADEKSYSQRRACALAGLHPQTNRAGC
jgi:hypothetical protein